MSCCDWARRGSWAAEQLLAKLGHPITKSLDPLDPSDFVLISVRLARALRGAAIGTEGATIKAAIEALDVDWPTISEDRRDQIIAAARAEVAGLAVRVPPLVEPILERSASSLVPLTRKAAISLYGLNLEQSAEWAASLVESLRDSQMVYVKSQFDTRATLFDSAAKDVVRSGLESGLGRDDISEALSTKLTPLGVERGTDYWNLIATDFSNKTRTTSQLSTFSDAGVKRYKYDAVMDQATSEFCRLLNGRVFSVEKARKRTYQALALRDPEEIRDAMPWVQQSGSRLYFRRGGEQHPVAHVDSPGVGSLDNPGNYSDVMSNKQLEAAGVTVPPRHGHCRSTITAV